MRRTRLRFTLRVLVAAVLAAAVGAGVTQGTRSAPANRAVGNARELVAASRVLAAQSPRIPAEISCSAVASLPGLGTIPGYPTSISSATDVPAASGNPEYCDVKGIIAPQTQFELKLPVSTWQGRYLQNGCGGYGTGPSHSYYDGCSDGGREAMEMAQRYPDDFDGIIAGAPEIIAAPLNAELQTWNYRVNTDPNGNPVLTADKVPALHAAVIKACSGDDGTADGIITDPRSCHFDPASIQCPSGTDSPSCLTPAQVQVVREIYQGPEDPQGRRLYPGGPPYGSELAWPGFVVPPAAGQKAAAYALSSAYLRYQMLPPGQLGPGPDQWAFDDQGFHRLFPVADTYDAMSTDLRAFRAHGGKLIIWQGWADQGIPTFGTVDYYDQLTRRMGGAGATGQFARMFLFPTVYHCAGGYGPASFDLVLPIVNWVENGTAPSEVIASETSSSGAVTLSRPVYPYPLIPRYNGSGPVDQASSFHPVTSPDAASYTPWIGDYLFSQPDS